MVLNLLKDLYNLYVQVPQTCITWTREGNELLHSHFQCNLCIKNVAKA